MMLKMIDRDVEEHKGLLERIESMIGGLGRLGIRIAQNRCMTVGNEIRLGDRR